MPSFEHDHPGRFAAEDGIRRYSQAAEGNRRRLRVFLLAFGIVFIAGLVFTFARTAKYRAEARLQLSVPTPGQALSKTSSEPSQERREETPASPGTELQTMTSRPLIERAISKIRAAGQPLPAGPDAVEAAHAMLEARLVDGSVRLVATGAPAEALAPLVNTLFEVYRDHLSAGFQDKTVADYRNAKDEEQNLRARVEAKRRGIDEFRARHNIVSLERDEYQVLAHVKGLGTFLTAANDKAVAAEARLRSISESIAAGKSVVRARDNPTLANLEQRQSQLREELREMERNYTAAYLAMDPRVRALNSRISDLDNQIRQTRDAGQQAALSEAQEEATAARAAANRLASQISGDRQGVQQFTARLGEYKAMQEELLRLETMHREAMSRATALETGKASRMPTVILLEAAVTPREPWSPNYTRDAAIALLASVLLALIAMWVVEFFNRGDAPSPLVVAPSWSSVLPTGRMAPTLPLASTQPLLEPPVALPRELDANEMDALLRAATDLTRIMVVALLSGLSADELLALHAADIDSDRGEIRLPDRVVPLTEPLKSIVMGADASQRIIAERADNVDDIETALIFAAHDAGLDLAGEISSASLRHTYTAFLVRQGIRFQDLTRLVGRLPPQMLTAYAGIAPTGEKLQLTAIDLVLPALARFFAVKIGEENRG